ncbi:hypothetical protein NPX13_g6655 [Xylaria arbuscula]|uniref:Cleavage/polyadenylation specificity factor A subunit N-terminal domain-containing protein n=1 Tax=Xylaria arbuscula TaxID=114810 RepID=A0A9W8NBT3_9PEZI|nr:hypothetical protein NPX13_g6655 [Xylaria arbuscula]
MASLQTHVLVDNEWVTRTVTADELIGSPVHQPTKLEISKRSKPPKCGILTRTVIESPVVRWVLPAQLRSFRFNDVALVGDHHVQISELDTDGQLRQVSRKVYTGLRIRNCQVIGTHDYLRKSKQDTVRRRTSDGDSTASLSGVKLFQQLLVLVLSDGSIDFLFMNETVTGDWDFVSSKHPTATQRLVDPGFHMTVSPDSQFMALGCYENIFVVYHLESIESLRKQYNKGLPIQPIKSIEARAIKGVIYQLEFLHPGPSNISWIVLSIITARSQVLRLAIYEWEDNERLEDALAIEKPGIRLDSALGMPLLVIPLTISCQFLLITEDCVTICSDILGGYPRFTDLPLKCKDASEWHHGSRLPMWTAWTRPLREESYHAGTDFIYLVREDGWVNQLEISNYGIEASLLMGPLECNVDSGFAAVSSSHGDILIASGADGHGKIWIIEARRNPKLIGQLPNWSPTVDMALVNSTTKPSRRDHKKLSKQPSTSRGIGDITAPERVFACSGRDRSSAIVELRYGVEAKIGLDLLYTSPIKKCWPIPSLDPTTEEGFFMLLALPENSAVLHISHDLSKVSEKDHSQVMFDLLSTTLAVHLSRDTVIQVTTTQATFVSPHGCYQHRFEMIEDQSATVIDAAITDDTIALSAYANHNFKLILYRYDENKLVSNHAFDVEGEITALSTATFPFGTFILVGLSQRHSSSIAIFRVQWDKLEGRTLSSSQQEPIVIKLGEGYNAESKIVSSITAIGDDNIVVGLRNGDALTICSTDNCQPENQFGVVGTFHSGTSPAYVFNGPVLATGPSSLICTDRGVVIMMEQKLNPSFSGRIFQLWLTDANEPHFLSPTINSVTGLHQVPDYDSSTWAMVSGERIFITEIQPYAEPVPRYLPVGGTPKAIIYSERLDALATIIEKKGIDSLHFIDPTTGADISRPIRKLSKSDDEFVDVDYISGLGTTDITVTSLFPWAYEYETKTCPWFVILAKTRDDQGLVLVISAEKEEALAGNEETSRRICFYTRNVKRINEALPRTGTTDKHGLFVSFKSSLEYYVIEDKKFKRAMVYELPSPAMRLEVVDGHLHALTTRHSLLVLDYKSEDARRNMRMIRMHTDELSRMGLSSISSPLYTHINPTTLATSTTAVKERQHQQIVLVSDPMCRVFGLWLPSKTTSTSGGNLQLLFEAHLGMIDQETVLGLAIDGSVTQFSILDENAWGLLAFIQNRLLLSSDHTIYSSDNDEGDDDDDGGGSGVEGSVGAAPEGEESLYDRNFSGHDLVGGTTSFFPTAKGHINGDLLQRCLGNRRLENIFSNPQHLAKLRTLLIPFGLDEAVDMQDPMAATATAADGDWDTDRVIKTAYDLLEYYLAPAI